MSGAGKRAAGRHAFAAEDSEAQVARLMPGLAMFCEGPEGLARALRQARKAARAGGRGYDPARHAALLRLARRGREKDDQAKRVPAGAGTRTVCQSPSNKAVDR